MNLSFNVPVLGSSARVCAGFKRDVRLLCEIVLLRANPLGFAGGRQQTILKVNGNHNEGRLALWKGNSKQKGASALGKVKHMKKFVTLLTVLLLVATAGTAYAGGGAVGSQGNPGITPPQAKPHGLTYGEWSAVWWEWSFSLPLSQNPMFMDGNVDLSLHQPDGPVWFLGGTFITHTRRTWWLYWEGRSQGHYSDRQGFILPSS